MADLAGSGGGGGGGGGIDGGAGRDSIPSVALHRGDNGMMVSDEARWKKRAIQCEMTVETAERMAAGM